MLNQHLIFYSLNARSDECGRVFVYRRDGTRFDKNHVQIKDRSGRKSVPVFAWFSASGAGDFVRIHGTFTAEKYLEILGDTVLPSVHIRYIRGSTFWLCSKSLQFMEQIFVIIGLMILLF